MGAIKGSVTVRRYGLKGDPPHEQAKLMKGIRAHVHIPIDPKTDVERSHGWAVMQDPDDLDLTPDKVFSAGVVCLTLRVDTLKPPAAVVKRIVAEKLKALGRKPNKAEKTAMKDEVKKSLRGRYLPTTRTIDVVWQSKEGRVFFYSHGKGANEMLVELFFKTFGVELVPLGPGVVAGRGSVPAGTKPTPEMIFGFPGLPGRSDEPATEEAEEEMVDAA